MQAGTGVRRAVVEQRVTCSSFLPSVGKRLPLNVPKNHQPSLQFLYCSDVRDDVKLRREAFKLKGKAIASLRRGVRAFNDFDDEGRTSTVLLHLQHAFEMLLKAGLVQHHLRVFDPSTGRSIGFDKCVNLGMQHLGIKPEESGTLRAIDALRDDEQHWISELAESLLYVHCRAATTLFDDLLRREFDDALANHLPHRVLPLSAEIPRDIQLLLDDEYSQVADLLRPGRRRRPDARARIRALLAMEAHVREDGRVSKKDVDRVEKAIKAGGQRDQVFPTLSEIATDFTGEGVNVEVRFVKRDGLPVRLVGADEEVAAGAVRQVDLQRKFHWTKTSLSEKVGLSAARCKAIRWYLGLDDDDTCRHDFTFGSQTHRQYSDNALRRLRDAMESGLDVEAVYRLYKTNDHGSSPPPTSDGESAA